MSDKPKWMKLKGEKKVEFLAKLMEWELEQDGIVSFPKTGKSTKIDKSRMCERCEWWVAFEDKKGQGECYRFPEGLTTFGTHWCAEFVNNNKHILGDG